MQGAGLLAVAVVAGLIWWLIRHDSGPSDEGQQQAAPTTPAGEFQFDTAGGPVVATDCAANAYGETAKWFATHPCQRLSRALYLTTSGGARALVSVALVTMPDPQQAQQLKAITDTDNTGNVNDLVKDGTAKIPGAPKVYAGQYDSRVEGNEVTIVEAEFFDKHSDDALLKRIGADAVRLAAQLH